MIRIVLAAALTFVAACAEPPATYRDLEQLANRNQRETLTADTCQAAAHQGFIGTQGADIDRSTLPAGTRVICHNCSATMDYRAERLNIVLGADGKVARVHCG